MANRHRGEIEAKLDGTTYRLCLTLGALAELESAFGDTDMVALAERFESGRLRAQDCVRIIGAGLRAGGHDISDECVSRMQTDRGIQGYVDIVARLLQATFGAAEATSPPAPPAPIPSPPAPAPKGERPSTLPFPGTTR